jgi:acetyl esterase/lipase
MAATQYLRVILGSLLLAGPLGADEELEKPPFYVPDNVTVHHNLVYSKAGNRQVLADLYLPKAGSGPFPAVVYVHGSGMPGKGREGSKDAFRRQAALLAAKGFVGLTISYRFRTEVRFPGCISDAKAAVRWLRANAREYRVDSDRIAIVGGSWGGYIASMVATTGHLAEFDGDGGNPAFSSRVKAAVAFNSLLDPIGHNPQRRADRSPGKFIDWVGATYEERPDLWEKASPLAHADKHSPPFLFLSGTKDPTDAFAESKAMMQKLLAAGVQAEFFTAEGARHGFFHDSPWFERTLKRTEEFLTKYLK